MTPADTLEDLYENAPCGFLSTTDEGVITRVNHTFLAWTGFTRDDLVGRRFVSILDKGGQLFFETRYAQVLRLEGEVREVTLTVVRPDGRAMPILVNSTVVTESGTRGIRTAVFDATSRNDYERELLQARRSAEASEARVRILQDASNAFGLATSEEELAEALAKTTRSAFLASAVVVRHLDVSGTLHQTGGDPALGLLLEAIAGGPESTVLDSGRTLIFASLDEVAAVHPELVDGLRAERVEAFSISPMVGESDRLGTVICYFRRSQVFDPVAVELKETLARQAALVLDRIRLQLVLRQLALHDQLTGLANRTLLQDRLSAALATARHADTELAVIFIDLDGFKAVNDIEGHAAGDRALQRVARQIKSAVRDDDLAGRLGGDEFVVICQRVDAVAAEHIAERIRAAIRGSSDGEAGAVTITASVGVALTRPAVATGTTVETLFALADEGMYSSKENGKDKITVLRG
jgi:diguanylate cyclase (GGDEF)-like protein/PAS domain S-box-containing protein